MERMRMRLIPMLFTTVVKDLLVICHVTYATPTILRNGPGSADGQVLN